MDERNLPSEEMKYALAMSWETHMQAFGPILEPAFKENPQVRILLVNALNHISRREVKRGMELLKPINEYCQCDADKAAWAFCVGLCFEMGGAKEQMLKWYAAAGRYKHRFYLPYIKLAKAAHGGAQFEAAAGYYKTAIECLLEADEADKDEVVLGSAYTNLCSCHTMLHQYDKALSAWEKAKGYPMQSGADATAAILFAAMGNAEKTAFHIGELKSKYPQWVPQTEEMTRQILNGEHPHFPSCNS